jgi:hypothetical protein
MGSAHATPWYKKWRKQILRVYFVRYSRYIDTAVPVVSQYRSRGTGIRIVLNLNLDLQLLLYTSINKSMCNCEDRILILDDLAEENKPQRIRLVYNNGFWCC